MTLRSRHFFPLLFLPALFTCFQVRARQAAPIKQGVEISIVTDAMMDAPARHGLEELTGTLASQHIAYETVTTAAQATGKYLLIAGLTGGHANGHAADHGNAAGLLQAGHHMVMPVAEALTIWRTVWRQRPAIVIAGYDGVGLMYALQEIARQFRRGSRDSRTAYDAGSVFNAIKNVTEKPAIRDRALSIYTMNRAYWESRFYDENYWARYLDNMARNRFNSLVVVFGYENGGFLAPCYPYFFNVEGYPGVRMVGLSDSQQQHNLSAIRKLIEMAHERGIRFTAGIWDHIYRGGVQGGGVPGNEKPPDHPTPGLVWGVTTDNLTAYTKTALAGFIRLIPADAIQFRMHDESGLKKEEQDSFWADVFKMIHQTRPDMHIDIRAKELPPTVIQSAINSGINFRIATKFWMEQFGLPYHPTRINPDKSYLRHSYGDLLRYPKRYRMVWRLWNGGTSRILLWGDPEYARRFMGSVHLYDGDGFEINEPLATKMEAQPHDARPFDLLQPQHRYYEYEFERYWHLFQVFGRLGYNPHTPSEVWDDDFETRFGKKDGPVVEEALHRASGILPRIIASSYPYSSFPMTRGWAEKQCLGELPVFARSEGSDLCQFADFDDEAALLLSGGETTKIRPSANAQWFAQTASDVHALVEKIRANDDHHVDLQGDGPPNKELASTLTDLEILSNLALYHARRSPAAVYYRLYERTHDPAALDSAIAHERQAIDAWRQIVASAGDYYSDNLQMGVSVAGLCGHWRDELVTLENGLTKLVQLRQDADPKAMTARAPVYEPIPSPFFDSLFRVVAQTPDHLPGGKSVSIRLRIDARSGIKAVRLYYRAVNQQLEYKELPMKAATGSDEYLASIPVEEIDPTYDLMYYVGIMDGKGNGRIYPDLNKETPYRIISFIR
jgi:hypothetical protein